MRNSAAVCAFILASVSACGETETSGSNGGVGGDSAGGSQPAGGSTNNAGVQIYELVGNSGDSLPKEKEQAFSHFAAGLEAYRQQHWQEALELFTQCLTLLPEDGPSRTMLERCQIYQQAPPPTDWDGVFTMTTK